MARQKLVLAPRSASAPAKRKQAAVHAGPPRSVGRSMPRGAPAQAPTSGRAGHPQVSTSAGAIAHFRRVASTFSARPRGEQEDPGPSSSPEECSLPSTPGFLEITGIPRKKAAPVPRGHRCHPALHRCPAGGLGAGRGGCHVTPAARRVEGGAAMTVLLPPDSQRPLADEALPRPTGLRTVSERPRTPWVPRPGMRVRHRSAEDRKVPSDRRLPRWFVRRRQ
jgi:hypothetical protein